MANEVKIKVKSDTREAGLGDPKRESAELRQQVEKDAAAMKAASERLETARRREADAAGSVRVAQLRLTEAQENGKTTASQLAAAEERLETAQRRATATQEAAAAAADKLTAARERAAKPVEDAAPAEEKSSGPNIDWSTQLGVLKKQAVGELKSAGVLAGAAFVGGLGPALTSVGAAGVFVGIAAAAQSSNTQVREAYSQLWAHVKAGAQDASSEVSGDFIGTAESLGRTFNALQPQMVDAFQASRPLIHDVTDGVDRLAKMAMPGLVTAAHASADASDGLADTLESTGRSVSNFFEESSKGAPAAGEDFAAFGRIVERMGSFAGRVLADLANNSQAVFPALETAVDATADTVENLADTALPALASGAALSLTGLGLLLNLANVLLTALGPLAPAISNVATSMKLVDMITFGGVARSWDTFKTSLSEAEGLGGKVKAGLSGVVGTLGPMGLLAGVGAIALDSMSAAQQRAAQAESDHRNRIRSLSDALRESNGVVNDSVRALAAKQMLDTKVGEHQRTIGAIAKDTGLSVSELTDAYLGNAAAQQRVNEAFNDFFVGMDENTPYFELAEDVANLRDEFPGLTGEFGAAKTRQEQLNDAMHNGAGAADAQRKALQDLQEQLDGMVDKDLAYRNAVDATSDAEAAAAEALKKHGSRSEEYSDALRGVEGAMVAQARASRDLATINSTAASEAGRAADGQRAYAHEVLEMASAAGDSAPPALRQMISGLSDADLTAMRAARSVDGAGNAVYRLPNGKTMVVSAEDDATWKAQRVQQALAAIKPFWTVTLTVNEVIRSGYGTAGTVPGSRPLSQGGLAAGGGVGSVRAHAAEGGARSGSVLVNELGREWGRAPNGIVRDLETGTQVIPAGNVNAMSQSGAMGGPVNVQLSFVKSGDRLLDAIIDGLRAKVQSNGGDVDRLFGGNRA